MGEGTFNLFDFSADLNPVRKALGDEVPSVSNMIPTNPSPAIGTYSPPPIRKKNIPKAKPEPSLPPAIGKLKPDEVKFLIDSGYSDDVILEMAFEEEKPKGFIDKVSESASKRFSTALKTSEDESMGKVTKALATGGEAVGFLGDVIGSAISTATPDVVKQAAKEIGGEMWESIPEPIQNAAIVGITKGGESWAEFEKAYPETARNVTSVFQIGSAIPVGKFAKSGGELAVEGAKQIPGAVKGATIQAKDAILDTATDKVGRIVARKEIAEGGGIFENGKLIGTQSAKERAARQLSGAEGTAYNAKLAEKTALDFTPEEITKIEKASFPANATSDILNGKITDSVSLQKEVARVNPKRFTEEDLVLKSSDGTIVENPVRKGLDKIETSKGLSLDERAQINAWRKKLNEEGNLSAEDVSDISIMMGKKQNDFTQLVDGVRAKDVEFERLRKEVKEVYRNNSPQVARDLDEKLHALIDTKSYIDDLAENVKVLRASTTGGVGVAIGKFLANMPLVGGLGVGVVRGALRTELGSGKFAEAVMKSSDFADKIADNIKKIQKLSKDVKRAKTEKEALDYIKKATEEAQKEALKQKLLPPASGLPQSAKEIDLRKTIIPSKGFNSPEITPNSKITIPSTSAKLKPYKEPNYKTPLPRKKNIPKPKK